MERRERARTASGLPPGSLQSIGLALAYRWLVACGTAGPRGLRGVTVAFTAGGGAVVGVYDRTARELVEVITALHLVSHPVDIELFAHDPDLARRGHLDPPPRPGPGTRSPSGVIDGPGVPRSVARLRGRPPVRGREDRTSGPTVAGPLGLPMASRTDEDQRVDVRLVLAPGEADRGGITLTAVVPTPDSERVTEFLTYLSGHLTHRARVAGSRPAVGGHENPARSAGAP